MPATPTDRVTEKARELGFSLVRVADPSPLGVEASRLAEWLQRGYQASMHWMERRLDKRADPSLVLPGVKSIVVTALNYYTPQKHDQDSPAGKVSRYAWGDDYHAIVLGKLELLAAWIGEQFPGSRSLAYVDTGPIMEKALAARSGIGWQGKHTNVITREYGSWIFLGELLTTVELAPDPPAVDHCGTCTLCIDACPTNAITEPYVVDSGRCISYLTIEHRGEIAEPLAKEFGRWVFGCDICQDVCPWNERFSQVSPEPGFAPRDGNVHPPLEPWSMMGEEEFNHAFAGSPIRRARWEGLRRNARIALQQSSDPPPAF